MNKHDVIDLRIYRDADLDQDISEDPAAQYLRAGTMLLHGQYTLTGYLNCGGFGLTYRAKDSLGRDVVIKECFPSALCYRSGNAMRLRTSSYKDELDSIVDQFIKEAKRLANLQHDNIVHVHQIFEENDTAYMAMDFIDGPDLLDLLDEDSVHFTPEDIEFLTEKMLHAIKFVHDNGMLHRDISPDNILIDKQGEPVLIDFGSARDHTAASGHSLSRLKFVKDGYSPQEFYIAGSAQGTWSDLYSFAASIYHMVSGAAPEDGQKRLAAIAAKDKDPYVPLSGRARGYAPRFLEAIDKALEILPDDRLQTADDWLAMLVGTSRAAPGVGAVLGLQNWSKRHGLSARHGIAAAAAISVAAIGITAALLFAPVEDPAAGLSPFATLADDGPLEVAEIAAIATERVEYSAPRLVESAPLVLGALLPADLDAPGIVTQDRPAAPRVAAIEALPVQGIELVSLPPSMAPVLAIASTGLGQPEAETLGLRTGSSTAPVPRPILAALSTPDAETPPTGVRISLRPDVAAKVADVVFAPGVFDPVALTLTPDTAPMAVRDMRELPDAIGETLVSVDVMPPPYVKKPAPLAEAQIEFSHWNVVMPFQAVPEQLRNSHTIRISAITDAAGLAMSGSWIKKDVVIYSFNGETLAPDTPLSTLVLNSMLIDPDGFARATVRYRDPESGLIDRGLLAVPVIREIGLKDGSRFEARIKDLAWEISVISVGPATKGTLRPGDVLTRELTTGVVFGRHEDLTKALEMLVERKIATADFAVSRAGREVQADWSLSRSD